MGVYVDALKWASERGDSGGAMRMRKALMSLYNWWWQYPIGEALAGLDAEGQRLLLSCLVDYASLGETEELRAVGKRIKASGYIDRWQEMMQASHEAQAVLRRKWDSES